MKYLSLFENYNKIEEIEDYFLELSDHRDNKLPIKVEVTNHKINKSVKNIKGFNKVSKFIGIPGYKITILFDFYDQVYIKKKVELAISRLKKDYNIHYNQISKRGNGNTFREIPIHGTDRVSYVSDPLWKQIITISPKKLNESLKDNGLDSIEDFLDMTKYNAELDITGYYKQTFDIFTKSIIGDNNTRVKQELLYGNITNADIMKSKCESIVNCIVSRISFKIPDMFTGGLSSKEYLLSKFKRLILLCPNIIIFYKMLSSTGNIGNNPNSRLYEFVFFINPIND